MKTWIKYIVAALLLNSGCIPEKNDPKTILNKLVDEGKATDIVNDTTYIDVKGILKHRTKPYTGLIYLLNADCSFCVGQFLYFLSYLKDNNVNLPVLILVEEAGTGAARFYMGKTGFDDFKSIEFVENSNQQIVNDGIENISSTVILIVENEETGRFLCDGFELY